MTLNNNSTAVVTGASSGIGRAVALELARRGTRLLLVARRGGHLDDVVDEISLLGGRAIPVVCDVTDRHRFEEAINRCVDEFGTIDILVNNAGRGHFAYIDNTPDEQIESIFRLNVFSLWYGTAAALPHMRRQRSGVVVNISSMAGKIGYPANAVYVAAKHATVGFTRALRSELLGSGVEAMVVVPAGVMTDWATSVEGGSMLDLFGYEAERSVEIAADIGIEPWPSIALLTAEEAARTIVESISNPVAELYTNPGTRELALAYQEDQEGVERRLAPAWLANLEYGAGKRRTPGDTSPPTGS